MLVVRLSSERKPLVSLPEEEFCVAANKSSWSHCQFLPSLLSLSICKIIWWIESGWTEKVNGQDTPRTWPGHTPYFTQGPQPPPEASQAREGGSWQEQLLVFMDSKAKGLNSSIQLQVSKDDLLKLVREGGGERRKEGRREGGLSSVSHDSTNPATEPLRVKSGTFLIQFC